MTRPKGSRIDQPEKITLGLRVLMMNPDMKAFVKSFLPKSMTITLFVST